MKIKSKGFTLVELVAVVVIIGVLASILVPNIYKAKQKSKQAEAISILTKMYQGYKVAIVDGIICPCLSSYNMPESSRPAGTGSGCCPSGSPSRKRYFNPDESNITPNDPTGRSALGWAALGFDQNPNYENSGNFFSYDFLKPKDGQWANDEERSSGSSASGRGPGATAPRPSDGDCSGTVCDGMNLGVAWLKSGGYDSTTELYNIDSTRWIAIDMDTGRIYKSDYYK